MKYMPLGSSFKTASIWNPILEKMEKKLSGWKRLYLSKGGRLTLLRSTLSSLPTYFLSLFTIPKVMATRMESIQRNFLWGSFEGSFKYPLVAWENGKFDPRSYYHVIRGTPDSLFKGVWKPKVPKRVAFFLWTTAHDWILTLDNLMLGGRLLANWCCMCCCDGESVDHLLLHCPVTHTLWTFMLQAFGINWVMLGSVVGLLFCWHQWLGKHNSSI